MAEPICTCGHSYVDHLDDDGAEDAECQECDCVQFVPLLAPDQDELPPTGAAPRAIPVLTLHQPWASLIALGVKTIETRSWSTKYRGPLAIHAGKKVVYGPVGDHYAEVAFSDVRHVEDCDCESGEIAPSCVRGATTRPCLTKGGQSPLILPLGAVVATCTLVDVVPTGDWPKWHLHVLRQRFGGESWDDGQWNAALSEGDYGDFTPGRFAWLLADVTPLDPPVPFKGGQGLTRKWSPVPHGSSATS
jgi:hypothetical protein